MGNKNNSQKYVRELLARCGILLELINIAVFGFQVAQIGFRFDL